MDKISNAHCESVGIACAGAEASGITAAPPGSLMIPLAVPSLSPRPPSVILKLMVLPLTVAPSGNQGFPGFQKSKPGGMGLPESRVTKTVAPGAAQLSISKLTKPSRKMRPGGIGGSGGLKVARFEYCGLPLNAQFVVSIHEVIFSCLHGF